MSLPPIYSRRKREAQKEVDVYVYDQVPRKARVQVTQILRDGLGLYFFGDDKTPCAALYDYLYKHMCKELGVHQLSPTDFGFRKDDMFLNWLEHEQDIDNWLDGLEAALTLIDGYVRANWVI
jgi:hypothetical protein